MKRNVLTAFTVAISLLMIGGPILAHHGTANLYDYSHRITGKAVVTELLWTNPHAQLYFDIKDNAGNVVNWGVELNSPGNLIKLGWIKSSFKPGEEITVTFVPAREGRTIGACGDFVKADGRKLRSGQGCGGVDMFKLPVKPGYDAVK
jgi:hypothetical protein